MQPIQPTPTKPEETSAWALGRLLAQMPPEVAQSLDDRQRSAIQSALIASSRKRHPLDLRLSIPLLRRRYYLLLLVGEEARSKARRRGH